MARTNIHAVADTAQTAGDIPALVTTVDTVVDGIQADLDNGTDGLGAIKATADAIETDTQDLQTQVGAAGAGLTAINLPDQTMNITGNLSGSVGSVTGSVGSNLELGPAEVNAEVVDVLTTDTIAEPTGVPAATTTLATKIGYLYMALRNRVDVTATKKTFYDDTDAAEWEKDLSDNGTTYTETEGNAI
jgi:hypothetical protein